MSFAGEGLKETLCTQVHPRQCPVQASQKYFLIILFSSVQFCGKVGDRKGKHPAVVNNDTEKVTKQST